MAYFLNDLRNRFDFFFRRRITFSRRNYCEVSCDINNVFKSNEENVRYNLLKEKYGSDLEENLSPENVRENIYFLELFDKYLTKKGTDKFSVLDIGSKNWSYVKSEYMFFRSFGKEFILNGIELDAYRLSSDFYTRAKKAEFYTKSLVNTKYIAGDFLEHSLQDKKYDYIIWILPFITEYPLMRWGLPLNYFKPEEMLMHAYNLLNEGGEIFIINQGEAEFEIQKNLNRKLKLPYVFEGEAEDNFHVFKNKRYCSKIIK